MRRMIRILASLAVFASAVACYRLPLRIRENDASGYEDLGIPTIEAVEYTPAGRDLRVLEIPIAFRDRRRGKSKMTFAVALLFGMRWIAAASRVLARRPPRPTAALDLRAGRDLPLT